MDLHQVVPLLATVFAVPQLLPQLVRSWRTGDPSGVSATWAALTAVSNVAWLTYFVSIGLVSAVVPTTISAVLATGIVVALAQCGVPVRRVAMGATGWAIVLGSAYIAGGHLALGGVLAVAFTLQVVPSVRHAWTRPRATGVSRPTWLLIAAEVTCWGPIGVIDGRAPLVFLFSTGVTASMLMLWLTRPSGPRAGGAREPVVAGTVG
jgi:uncharacterized protein with PQ loop repeat